MVKPSNQILLQNFAFRQENGKYGTEKFAGNWKISNPTRPKAQKILLFYRGYLRVLVLSSFFEMFQIFRNSIYKFMEKTMHVPNK